jgi:toxin-antitoxin system PIN domain toxin
MYLPDINIWLALVFQLHGHHTRVLSWFETIHDKSCAFCRVTQQGLLRLSTNPAIFKDETITMERAWDVYERLLTDPRIFYSQEPDDLATLWKKYTIPLQYSHKVWTDAYLAAYAKGHNFSIITFDKGFAKFKDVDCLILDS